MVSGLVVSAVRRLVNGWSEETGPRWRCSNPHRYASTASSGFKKM